MASKTKDFFESGTSAQYEWVLGHYDQALRLKAESKSSKPENVIKLDKWYQNDLPKKIKSRGKDAHLTHEEMVQTIKWKLARGKFRPNLVNLVQMNTPRVIVQETKKTFRSISKKEDVQAACAILCNLKGVGPAMASAVLAAGCPHLAPFMADECLLAMPDVDSLDYTMKEYMSYVEHVKQCVARLNDQGGDWNPHKVELAIWTHYILNDLKPELLNDLPSASGAAKPAAAEEDTAAAAAESDPSPAQAEASSEEASPSEPTEDGSALNDDAKAPEDTTSTSEPSQNGKNGHSSSEDSSCSAAEPPAPVNGTNGNGVAKEEETAAAEPVTNGSSENGSAKLSEAASESPVKNHPVSSPEVTKRVAMPDEDSGATAAKKIRTEEPPQNVA